MCTGCTRRRAWRCVRRCPDAVWRASSVPVKGSKLSERTTTRCVRIAAWRTRPPSSSRPRLSWRFRLRLHRQLNLSYTVQVALDVDQGRGQDQTLKHYTAPDLTDTFSAIEKLQRNTTAASPQAGAIQKRDDSAVGRAPQLSPPLARETTREDATPCKQGQRVRCRVHSVRHISEAGLCEMKPHDAQRCGKYPQRESNPCFQDENLASCRTSIDSKRTCRRRKSSPSNKPRNHNAIISGPPELLVLLEAWDNLPQPIRIAIRAMVDSLDLPKRG